MVTCSILPGSRSKSGAASPRWGPQPRPGLVPAESAGRPLPLWAQAQQLRRRAAGVGRGADAAGQDGAGERGPHRKGAAPRVSEAASSAREYYRVRPTHSFRMASVIAVPWRTRTTWLPCGSSVPPKEKATEG